MFKRIYMFFKGFTIIIEIYTSCLLLIYRFRLGKGLLMLVNHLHIILSIRTTYSQSFKFRKLFLGCY